MGDHRLSKKVMSRELENTGKRGPLGKEKQWTDCVAEDRWVFGMKGEWSTAVIDPGVWYRTVCKGGCRFMAAWMREEEMRPKTGRRREKRKRRTRLSCIQGDRNKLKTFKSRAEWTDPRTPQAALAVPTETPENPANRML